MNVRDKILKFKAFALASHTSLYNEDSTTASGLIIECNRKMVECMEVADALSTAVENMEKTLGITYDETTEELTILQKVEEIKKQINNSYVCIYNEDSMTALEQAGQCAKAVNECIKTMNMVSDLVLEINDMITLNYLNNEEMVSLGGVNNE